MPVEPVEAVLTPATFMEAEGPEAAHRRETDPDPKRMFDHPWVRRIAAGASALAMVGAAEGPAAYATEYTDTPPAPAQPTTKTTTTMRTSEGTVSAKDVATKKVYLLEDVKLRGTVHMDQCHWTKGGFTNSGRDANGKIRYYHDNIPAKLCRSEASPTGFVKVAGGTTGRNCRNPATEKRAPAPVIQGEVKILRSLNMKIKLKALSKVALIKECGYAKAEASVYQTINLKSWLRKKGNGEIRSVLALEDKATTKAEAKLKCVDTTTTTETTTTTPNQPTPKPENMPPTVSIENKPIKHDIDTDQLQICAMESDPDGDVLDDHWSAEQGNVSSSYHPDPQQYGKICVMYTPNDVPYGGQVQENVKVVVKDGHGHDAQDIASFPVVDDNVRPF
jgi:hypothetical protein